MKNKVKTPREDVVWKKDLLTELLDKFADNINLGFRSLTDKDVEDCFLDVIMKIASLFLQQFLNHL